MIRTKVISHANTFRVQGPVEQVLPSCRWIITAVKSTSVIINVESAKGGSDGLLSDWGPCHTAPPLISLMVYYKNKPFNQKIFRSNRPT